MTYPSWYTPIQTSPLKEPTSVILHLSTLGIERLNVFYIWLMYGRERATISSLLRPD